MIKVAPFSFGLILEENKVVRPTVAVVRNGHDPIVCCYCGSVIFKTCKFCPECGVKFKLYKSKADFPTIDVVQKQLSLSLSEPFDVYHLPISEVL